MYLKKKTFLLLILSIVSVFGLSGCVNQFDREDFELNQKDRVEYFTIGEDTGLSSYLGDSTYVGHIKSSQRTTISSKVGGRLIKSYVKKGDYVKEGDVLAELDGQELTANYDSTSQMLSSLNMMYTNTSMMYDSQVMAMEQQVDQSKLAMELASTTAGGTASMKLEQTKLAEDTASSELVHTQNILSQKELDLYSNSKTVLSQSQVLLENIGVYMDELLGVSSAKKNYNDDFEIYLSAKNTSYKVSAKSARSNLNNKYTTLQAKMKNIINGTVDMGDGGTVTKIETYSALQDVESFIVEVRDLLEVSYNMTDASVTSTNLTQESIDAYKQKISSYQSQLDGLGIKTQRQAIDNFNKESSMQLDLLDKKQNMAINQYEITKDQTNKGYEIAEKQYQEALAGLAALRQQKSMKLAEIQSQISQIGGNKNVLGVQLDDTKIIAPFDGVVIEKMMEVGQVTGPGVPVYEIANDKDLRVEVFIPESKISLLDNLSGASVYIPSIDKTYTGDLYTVAPSSDILSKKVSVEFSLKDLSDDITIGMYCEVFIEGVDILADEENLLDVEIVIPYKFISYEFGMPYVFTKEDCLTKAYCPLDKKYIELLQCNNDMCVIEGVNNGDIIAKP